MGMTIFVSVFVYDIICVEVELIAFNVLLHTKSEQKVISN